MQHSTKVKVTKPGTYQVSFTATDLDKDDGKVYKYHVSAVLRTVRGRNCVLTLDLDVGETGMLLTNNRLFQIIDNRVYKEEAPQ